MEILKKKLASSEYIYTHQSTADDRYQGKAESSPLPGPGRVKQTYYYNGIFSAEAIESEEMTPCRGDEKNF